MMQLREMSLEDVPEIYQIEKEVFAGTWSESSIESCLWRDIYFSYVITCHQEILGYFIAASIFDEGELLRIAVLPKYRKRGIGRQLMQHYMQKNLERGVEKSFLEVRKSNIAAISLYKKMGFAITGSRKNYYTAPTEDALIMNWQRLL